MRHEKGFGPLGVQRAVFSRNESRILSWGHDNTVRLWDASTGRELVPAMRHEGGVRHAAFNRDESRILSWGYDTVRMWDISRLSAGNLLEVACKRLSSPDVSSPDVSDVDGVYGIRIVDPICGPNMLPPDWSQMK